MQTKGRKPLPLRREGVPEDEAKPGDLDAREMKMRFWGWAMQVVRLDGCPCEAGSFFNARRAAVPERVFGESESPLSPRVRCHGRRAGATHASLRLYVPDGCHPHPLFRRPTGRRNSPTLRSPEARRLRAISQARVREVRVVSEIPRIRRTSGLLAVLLAPTCESIPRLRRGQREASPRVAFRPQSSPGSDSPASPERRVACARAGSACNFLPAPVVRPAAARARRCARAQLGRGFLLAPVMRPAAACAWRAYFRRTASMR